MLRGGGAKVDGGEYGTSGKKGIGLSPLWVRYSVPRTLELGKEVDEWEKLVMRHRNRSRRGKAGNGTPNK